MPVNCDSEELHSEADICLGRLGGAAGGRYDQIYLGISRTTQRDGGIGTQAGAIRAEGSGSSIVCSSQRVR